jgi:hypothetical protein
VEFQEYDDMMRRMLAIVVHMESAIDELRTFNRQQVEINARLEITQARIETLLTRLLRGEADNGRDA